MKNSATGNKLGEAIKQRRTMIPLTLRKLAVMSAMSPSHLGRVERGERFPSASILRRLARPLGFEEIELFSLAGYLSSTRAVESSNAGYCAGLDPYVSRILGQEPAEVQYAIIGFLDTLKGIARALDKELK